MTAPELSPTERAIVERFERSPDALGLREEVAEMVATHQTEQLWKAGGWAGDTACSCGWRMAMWSRKDFPAVHRAHVADALAELIEAREKAAGARALRDFAMNPCERNAKAGLTEVARHFGRTYAQLAHDRADRIEARP